MAEFRMPALGADLAEGRLLEWLVKPGDEVHDGDIIAVVDTAGSAVDVASCHTGTVERLVTEPGTTVPAGAVLAIIEETSRAAPPSPARPAPAVPQAPAAGKRAAAARVTPLIQREAKERGVDLTAIKGTGRNGAITRADVEAAAGHERAAAPQRAALPKPAAREPAPARELAPAREPAAAVTARRRVTPLARLLAAELGVDLRTVTGTGPGGTVREADVRQAAPTTSVPAPDRPAHGGGAPPKAPPARATATAERLRVMRQAIAKMMARSKREIPHYYVSNTVDLSTALAWLRDRNDELEVSAPLLAALLLKAAALAARQVPQLNGFWMDGHFVPAHAVHLGTAVSLRSGGLVTPTIHNADTMPVGELTLCLRDLVNRARAGRLRGAELTGATITVTDVGGQGAESLTGIIYPPQVALVGFGKIIERPWAVGGLLGIRPTVVTTLSADHRATDGYTGARFLTTIAGLLQRPEEL